MHMLCLNKPESIIKKSASIKIEGYREHLIKYIWTSGLALKIWKKFLKELRKVKKDRYSVSGYN